MMKKFLYLVAAFSAVANVMAMQEIPGVTVTKGGFRVQLFSAFSPETGEVVNTRTSVQTPRGTQYNFLSNPETQELTRGPESTWHYTTTINGVTTTTEGSGAAAYREKLGELAAKYPYAAGASGTKL